MEINIHLSFAVKRAIQIANFFAILLVISIHYRSIGYHPGDHLSLNYIFQEFFTNGVARSAVPLFAFTSGLFFFYSYKPTIESYKNKLLNRTKTIFIPYLLSSFFFLAAYSILNNTFNYPKFIKAFITQPISAQMWFLIVLIIISLLIYFLVSTIESNKKKMRNKSKIIIIPFLLILVFFLVAYSILNNTFSQLFIKFIKVFVAQPISAQMWFLRDLIILILISPLIYYLVSKLRYLPIIFLFPMWLFNVQCLPVIAGWYIVDLDTLFFFFLGCTSIRHISMLNKIPSIKTKYMIYIFIVWASLLLIRIYLFPFLSTWYEEKYTLPSLILQKFGIMTGLIALIAFASRVRNKKILYLSGYTFFAFLFHKYPLEIYLRKYSSHIAGKADYSFYLSFPAALMIVFGCAFFLEKLFPLFYDVVSGGRSPAKALERTQ